MRAGPSTRNCASTGLPVDPGGRAELAHSVGILDRDGLSFAKLARVVVQLRETEDVFGDLHDVVPSMLNRNRQRIAQAYELDLPAQAPY